MVVNKTELVLVHRGLPVIKVDISSRVPQKCRTVERSHLGTGPSGTRIYNSGWDMPLILALRRQRLLDI